MRQCSNKTLSIKIVCGPDCSHSLLTSFLRWRYSVFIGHVLKVQLFCHGRNATKFYGSHPHSWLFPLHLSPTLNLHIRLPGFNFLEPRAAPFLSAEKPLELANTRTAQPTPNKFRSIRPSDLSFLFHTFGPLSCAEQLWLGSHWSRHWGYRTSSSVSSSQLGLSAVRVTWNPRLPYSLLLSPHL